MDICSNLSPSLDQLLYADDLEIFDPSRIPDERDESQAVIEGVNRWCRDNQMAPSSAKCAVPMNPHKKYFRQHALTFEGADFPPVNRIRDLGVIITQNLDFITHIKRPVASSRSNVYSIFRCSIVRRPEFYVRLYQSLIVSEVLYCSTVELKSTMPNQWIPMISGSSIGMLPTV